jgi:hypothetical protein
MTLIEKLKSLTPTEGEWYAIDFAGHIGLLDGDYYEANVFGLGEGGLVGCSNLAECFCPLLPNPCYMKCRLIYDKDQLKH